MFGGHTATFSLVVPAFCKESGSEFKVAAESSRERLFFFFVVDLQNYINFSCTM